MLSKKQRTNEVNEMKQPSNKPRNHVAAAKQSGAGRHKQADKTAMREAFERALYFKHGQLVRVREVIAPNNVREKENV